MTTTTGERTFSTSGRTVVKPQQELIPNGTYTGPMGDRIEIGKGKQYNSVPYINVAFEAEGTAKSEGGKNRYAFHRLLLGLKPGKDGKLNTDREAGVVALAKALKTEMEGVEIVEQTVTNPETGEEEKVEFLNPQQVRDWLKTFSGTRVKFRIGTTPAEGDYGPKNEIKSFMSAE